MNKHARTAAAAALGLAFGGTPWAQTSGTAGNTSEGKADGVVQSVTITSQKRKEDLRKVPLSVSVVSGDALEDGHVTNFADLSLVVPNMSFSTQAGAGLATLQVRGISSQAGSATMAVYLDDVSLTTRNLYSQGTAEPRFFDIDRVEVLRGPQGTLYGASALGGAIRFISKQPDTQLLGGNAMAEVSSTSHGGTNYNLQGVLNVPLSPGSVGLRVGVQRGHDSGYIDRVNVNTLGVVEKGINDARWDVAKLALKAQLSKGWSLTPALFYQRYNSGDIDAAYEAVGDYQSANAGAKLGKFQTSKIVREPGRDTLTLPSVTLDGDVGFGDLTGIVSGYKRSFKRVQDGTSINSPYIGSVVTDPVLGAAVGFLPSAVNLNNQVNQTSLELRLASKDYVPGGTPITWLAGLYAARTKTEVFDDEPVFGINAAFRAAGRNIEDPAQLADTFPGAFLGDSSYYSARHYNDRQNAIFGEVAYYLTPQLHVRAGLRVLHATQHFTREGDRYYAGGPSAALIDSSANATTPRLAMDWDLDRNTTVFVNVAKGFRLGSANRPVPVTPLVQQDLQTLGLPGTIPTAFKPDSLWSYEAGSKSLLAGGKVSLNVTAFYIAWKDIQQNVVLPESGFDFETNVGKAKSWGLEVESRARVTDALTLTAQSGLTHATFSQDMPALGTDANGVLNVRKGDRVQGVPRYNVGLGFEQRFPLFAGSGFVRGNAKWVGASRGTFVKESTDYERAGYGTADLSAGTTVQAWEFSVFAKNLTNNDKVIQRPSIQGVSTVYHLRPRTIGATARYDF